MNKKIVALLLLVVAVAVGIWLWLRNKAKGTKAGDVPSAGPEDNPVPGDDSSGDPGTYTPVDDGETPTDGETFPDPQVDPDWTPEDGGGTVDVNDPAAPDSTGSGVKPAQAEKVKVKAATTGGPRFKSVKYAGGTQKSDQVSLPRSAPDGSKWIQTGGFGTGAMGTTTKSFLSDSGRYKMGVVYAKGGYATSYNVTDLDKKVFSAAKRAK